MKMLRSAFILPFAAVCLLLASCSSNTTSNTADPAGAHTSGGKTMTKLGPEFTSAYICPMHCEGSGSDKPGKCPVCEMDLRENEDFKKPGGDSTGH